MSRVWNLSSSTFVLWSLYFKHSLCMRQQICFVLSWNEIWIFSKYVCCTSYDTKLYLYTLYFLHKIWICEASFGFPWQWTQNNRMWSLNLLFKSLSFHYRLHKFMLREIKTTHAVVNRCTVPGVMNTISCLIIYKAQIFLVLSNTLTCYSEDLGVAVKFHPSTMAKDNLLTVFSLHST